MIPVNILSRLFVESDKFTIEFIWKYKEPRKSWGTEKLILTLLDIKLYYKLAATKTKRVRKLEPRNAHHIYDSADSGLSGHCSIMWNGCFSDKWSHPLSTYMKKYESWCLPPIIYKNQFQKNCKFKCTRQNNKHFQKKTSENTKMTWSRQRFLK